MAGESTGRIHLREDFNQVVLYGLTFGVGTEIVTFVTDETGGMIRLSSSTTDNENVVWRGSPLTPSDGGLFIEAKVKLVSITIGAYNVGFSDVLDLTTPVLPFEFSGTTLTTAAVDGAAFLFDVDATTDVWRIGAVDTNVDTLNSAITDFGTIADTGGVAPVADVFDVLRVEVEANGTARFVKNGIEVNKTRLAVTPTAILFPYVMAEARSAATAIVEVAYVEYGANRG